MVTNEQEYEYRSFALRLERLRLRYRRAGQDFSKFNSKFACVRSARKFLRNLPVYVSARAARENFEKFAYAWSS